MSDHLGHKSIIIKKYIYRLFSRQELGSQKVLENDSNPEQLLQKSKPIQKGVAESLSFQTNNSHKQSGENQNQKTDKHLLNKKDVIVLGMRMKGSKYPFVASKYQGEQEQKSQNNKEFLTNKSAFSREYLENRENPGKQEKGRVYKSKISESFSSSQRKQLTVKGGKNQLLKKTDLNIKENNVAFGCSQVARLSNDIPIDYLASVPSSIKIFQGARPAMVTGKDNFFATYNSIAVELKNYQSQLENQRIFCPCDFWDKHAPTDDIAARSSFYEYFESKMESLKIKRLTMMGRVPPNHYRGIVNRNLLIARLEAIDFSKYDVVITCPPTSIFTYFIKKMIKEKIKFLIIGTLQAIKNKTVFDQFVANKIRFGYTNITHFYNSNKIKIKTDRQKEWFTNLATDKDKPYPLTKEYADNYYPLLDGSKIINVAFARNIPDDYDGLMAVPVSFTRHLSSQFKVYCLDNEASLNGRKLNTRLIIRRLK